MTDTRTNADALSVHTTTEDDDSSGGMSYGRFLAMILTSTVIMYGVMYLNSYEIIGHARFSETRLFMSLLMASTMAVVMLGFMLKMYRSTAANIGIVVTAIAVFASGLFMVRSQTTVQDRSYMNGMIPHHSIAVLTSERAELEDVRVIELADGIVKAQRKEIAEMTWLVDDIAQNGPAETQQEAAARPVPDFSNQRGR